MILPVLLLIGSSIGQAPEPTQAIRQHFEKVPSRLQAGNRLRPYGATLAQVLPDREGRVRLQQLALSWEAAPLRASPGQEPLVLAHELAPFDAPLALRLLRRCATRPVDPSVANVFRVALLAVGPEGEALALECSGSSDPGWRDFGERFLAAHAGGRTTGAALVDRITRADEATQRVAWYQALTHIGYPEAAPLVQARILACRRDDLQAAEIFTYVELVGHAGIEFLEKLRPIGPLAIREWEGSLAWLREETTPANPHGLEVGNDESFVARFADLPTPSLQWLEAHGLLEETAIQRSTPLKPQETEALLGALLQSQAFGLEACKGLLFHSIDATHEASLLKLAAANWVSPDAFSEGRAKTIGILLRKLRYATPAVGSP